MAKTIADIREQYPQYDDLSDQELAEGLHKKHYSDMPFEDFAERVGLAAPEGDVEVGQPTIVDRAASALMREDAPRRGDGSRYGAGPGIDWQGRPGGESARRQTEQVRAEREAQPAGSFGLVGIPSVAPGEPDLRPQRRPGSGLTSAVGATGPGLPSPGADTGPTEAFVEGARQGTLSLYESFYRTPETLKRFLVDLPNQGADMAIRALGGEPEALNPRVNVTTGPVGEFFDEQAEAFQREIEEGGNREAAAELQRNAEAANEALAAALDGDFGPARDVLTNPNAWAGFIGQAVPSLGASIASGGSAKFITWMEGMEAAKDAEDFEERTGMSLTPAQFARAVAQIAAANAMLEKAGVDQILKPGRGSAVRRLVTGGLAEGVTEGAQEFSANVGARTYDPERGLSEGVLAGAMGGFGSGAAAGGGLGALEQAARAEQAGTEDGARLPDGVFDADSAAQFGERLRRAQEQNRPVELTGPDDTVLRATPEGEVGTERQFNERARARQEREAELGIDPSTEQAGRRHPGAPRVDRQRLAGRPVRVNGRDGGWVAVEPADDAGEVWRLRNRAGEVVEAPLSSMEVLEPAPAPQPLPAPDRTLYGNTRNEVGTEAAFRERDAREQELGLDEVRPLRRGQRRQHRQTPDGLIVKPSGSAFRSRGDASMYARSHHLRDAAPVALSRGQWALRPRSPSDQAQPPASPVAEPRDAAQIRERIEGLERSLVSTRNPGTRQAIELELGELRDVLTSDASGGRGGPRWARSGSEPGGERQGRRDSPTMTSRATATAVGNRTVDRDADLSPRGRVENGPQEFEGAAGAPQFGEPGTVPGPDADARGNRRPEARQAGGDTDRGSSSLGGEPQQSRRRVTGRGLSLPDVEAVADGLMRNWAGAPPVSVVQTEAALPGEIREAIRRAGANGTIRGVWWRGEAYVVADNAFTRAEVEETILHEVVGHHGLRGLLGDDINPILDQVYLSVGRRGLQSIADEYGLDLGDIIQRRQAAEEHLAHLTESHPQSRVWDRFVRMFVRWMRRMGFRLRLTSAEIRDLLIRARRFVETGKIVSGPAVVAEHSVYRGTEHNEALYHRGGTQYASAQALRDAWRESGVDAALTERAGIITLHNIEVRASQRGRSRGSAFLEALTRYADETGQRIGLTPDPTAKEGSRATEPGLRKWYRRFGFVDNKGRGRDFEISESMVREPEAPRLSRRRRGPGGEIDPVLAEALRRAGLGKRPSRLVAWAQRMEAISAARARNIARELAHATAQGAVDRFHGIKRAELKHLGNLPAEQSAYVAARLSTGIASVMRAILHHGAPQWRHGVLSKVEGSKGLLQILEPVKGDLDTFLGWMVGRRARRLYEEGREHNFTREHIDALIRAGENSPDYQHFQRVAAEMDAFKKRVLDVAEEAGLIDGETRPAWDHSDYIPFYRATDAQGVMGGRGSLSGQNAGIRTLRGGQAALNDPLENLLMNFTYLMDASMKNHAIRQVQRNLDDSGVLEEVSPEFRTEAIPLEQIRGRLRQQGADPDLLPPEALQGIAKLWAMKPPSDPDVVRVMDGGRARYLRVTDPLLLRALTAVRDPGLNHPIINVMRGAKRILTRGVTADPAFMARNFLRDMLHAWTINEDSFRLGVDSIRGVTKTVTEKGGAVDMMFAGGSFLGGYVNANDPRETQRAVRIALRQKGYSAASARRFTSTIVDTPAKWWEVYTRIGDAVENASREAVYEAAGKAGKTRARAIFEAKDLMDYSMRGDWALIQFFGDVLPFFNARLQGLYKLGRAGARNPQRVAAHGTMIALASLALLARSWDDERYEELPEWDRDTYWHVFLPEEVVGRGLSHLRIPKPFEIGLLFGTIPERMALNVLGEEDTGKTFERFIWSLRETFAFDLTPQVINPLFEVWANRDKFRDAPIEGLADQGKLPEARFSEYTSATMRALGRLTGPTIGASPKQLEHLWRGYTGSMGMYALDVADVASRAMMDMPPQPEMRIDDWPVVRSFLRAEPARSTKYLTELYDLRARANQLYRTVRAYQREGQPEAARRLLEKEEELLQARGALRDAAQFNSRVRKEMDAIHRSEEMTPAEKRREIDELLTLRNENTKETIQAVEAFFAEQEAAE